MDAPIAKKKMEDSGATGEDSLQGSVSFGRFANDSLSWEKRSNFPTNKNLEEVEKCSSAGSVAQKKAYFEAHYKNIATRKAELEDKEKKRGTKTRDPMDSEDQTHRASLSDFKAAEPEVHVDNLKSQNCVNAIELESEVQNSGCEISSSETVEPKDAVDEMIESNDPLPLTEDVKDESCFRPGTPELHKSEESAVVKAEAPPLGSEEVKESPKNIAGTRDSKKKAERDKVKLEKYLKSEKVTSAKRAVSTSGVKKTPTSSTPKSSVMQTSKLSRPTLSKSITPTPKALSKKENSTSPLTSKKPTSVKSRRVAATSLHMSLNLDTANSEQAMDTRMRKSLIMERMGDKDIVKRAFKAFRSNFNQLSSSSPTKPSAASEIPGKKTHAKTSLAVTPSKKTEGGNKPLKKSNPLSGQTGLGKTSTSTRVPNTVGADQRNNKSVSSTHCLRSHDKGDRGNKVSKKFEDKVNSKAAERTQLQCKEKKAVENNRLLNSYNTKTIPISGTFASESSSQKGVSA